MARAGDRQAVLPGRPALAASPRPAKESDGIAVATICALDAQRSEGGKRNPGNRGPAPQTPHGPDGRSELPGTRCESTPRGPRATSTRVAALTQGLAGLRRHGAARAPCSDSCAACRPPSPTRAMVFQRKWPRDQPSLLPKQPAPHARTATRWQAGESGAAAPEPGELATPAPELARSSAAHSARAPPTRYDSILARAASGDDGVLLARTRLPARADSQPGVWLLLKPQNATRRRVPPNLAPVCRSPAPHAKRCALVSRQTSHICACTAWNDTGAPWGCGPAPPAHSPACPLRGCTTPAWDAAQRGSCPAICSTTVRAVFRAGQWERAWTAKTAASRLQSMPTSSPVGAADRPLCPASRSVCASTSARRARRVEPRGGLEVRTQARVSQSETDRGGHGIGCPSQPAPRLSGIGCPGKLAPLPFGCPRWIQAPPAQGLRQARPPVGLHWSCCSHVRSGHSPLGGRGPERDLHCVHLVHGPSRSRLHVHVVGAAPAMVAAVPER